MRWGSPGVARIGLNALVVYTGASFRNAGVSRYTTQLINALLRASDQHAYHVLVNDSVTAPPFGSSTRTRITRTRLPTARTSVRILWEQLVAPLHVSRGRFDLLHSFLNVVPLAAPTRHVVTVHDLSFRRVPEAHPAQRRWYLNVATRLSTRRAAAVLADSQATKRDLMEDFGVPEAKVRVVYPGTEPDFHPRPASEIQAFRATKGLDRPFVLFVGTLEPRKNVDALVRAFARMRRRGGFDGELMIAGGAGWGSLDLNRVIQESGCAEAVRLVGYVKRSELPLWYNSADLMVYPSSYEGFGIPVLEAMASGTPVITSNRSSLPEVVGNAGPTVDPRDDQHLASLMTDILASRERREAMRERGLAQAQRFQWTAAAQRCLEVYQRVLSRP